jgi:hypothetical protein
MVNDLLFRSFQYICFHQSAFLKECFLYRSHLLRELQGRQHEISRRSTVWRTRLPVRRSRKKLP